MSFRTRDASDDEVRLSQIRANREEPTGSKTWIRRNDTRWAFLLEDEFGDDDFAPRFCPPRRPPVGEWRN